MKKSTNYKNVIKQNKIFLTSQFTLYKTVNMDYTLQITIRDTIINIKAEF